MNKRRSVWLFRCDFNIYKPSEVMMMQKKTPVQNEQASFCGLFARFHAVVSELLRLDGDAGFFEAALFHGECKMPGGRVGGGEAAK